MPVFANWNGRVLPAEQINISPDNRSFKFGDGCFETIKVINGNIPLLHLHLRRLFSSLQVLEFTVPPSFTPDYISKQIVEAVNRNEHQALARVRLVIYRGESSSFESRDEGNLNFIIQSFEGSAASVFFNTEGLLINFYEAAVKSFDCFSALKSNNYLPYAMGALWAKKNGLDDCILLNPAGGVADATIANVFIVNDDLIKTPPLTSGCIDGVMRRYLLDNLAKDSIPFVEAEIAREELLAASEVFFTNANYGIRWVQRAGKSNYANTVSSFLHKKYIEPLFSTATF